MAGQGRTPRLRRFGLEDIVLAIVRPTHLRARAVDPRGLGLATHPHGLKGHRDVLIQNFKATNLRTQCFRRCWCFKCKVLLFVTLFTFEYVSPYVGTKLRLQTNHKLGEKKQVEIHMNLELETWRPFGRTNHGLNLDF